MGAEAGVMGPGAASSRIDKCAPPSATLSLAPPADAAKYASDLGVETLMNSELLNELTFFVLAVFVGIEVISKVPTILHTPLMSGTNAIHGIILVGALVIAAGAGSPVNVILGFLAVVLATTNVVGGFVVTDRMLEMFKGRQAAKTPEATKSR